MSLPLQELLVSMFSYEEFEMFVTSYDRRLAPLIKWRSALAWQVFEFAGLVIQHKQYTDPALYDALREARPRRAADIDAAEHVAQQQPHAAPLAPSPDSATTDSLQLALSENVAALPPGVTPSSLLVARHQVVEFAGRDIELQEFDEWADSERSVAVRLLHGPGGAGKTRLAIEWVKQRRRNGDTAGFLDTLDESTQRRILASGNAIIVVDYAESQAGLGGLLMQLVKNTPKSRKLRLLLLARAPGDWWSSYQGYHAAMPALLSDVWVLLPLRGGALAARQAEYARALSSLRAAVGTHQLHVFDRNRAASDDVPDLEHRRFSRVLYLHLAALAKVLGLALDAEALLGEILDHEQRLWVRRFEIPTDAHDTRRDFLADSNQLLAAITLRGPTTRQGFFSLARALGINEDKRLRATERLFRDLYPAAAGRIGPLEPDLLGEALVLRVAIAEGDEWQEKVLYDA